MYMDHVMLVPVVVFIYKFHCTCMSTLSMIIYKAHISFYSSVLSLSLLQASCTQDLLLPGAAVAASNLQWRQASATKGSLPTVVSGDLTQWSQNPRESHLKIGLRKLRRNIKVCFMFAYCIYDTL